MKLKEIIENNIIIILLASGVTVGAIVYRITVNLKNNEIEKIRTSYQEKISKFNLVSSDSNHIDMSKLIVEKNEPIPNFDQLKYFSTDHFYAEKSNPSWTYYFTNDTEIRKYVTSISDKKYEELIKDEPILNSMNNDIFKEYQTKYPIHLWRINNPISLDCKNEKIKFYPNITIQRLDADAMIYIAENALNSSKENIKNLYEISHTGSKFDSTLLDTMKIEMYRKMKKGFSEFLFYSKTFDYAGDMLDRGIDFELTKVIKSGDSKYAKIIWKSQYCESKPELSFFMIEEFFILKLPDCVFSVNIKIPSYTPNPDTKIYSEINNFIIKTRFVK